MADLITQGPDEPPPTPTSPAEVPVVPAEQDDRLGRYEANIQLILRRLADHERTNIPKSRWWWQSR